MNFWFICDVQLSTYFHMYNSWNKNHNILLVLALPKEFVYISILLNKSKIVRIWMKIFISRVRLKAQRKSDHILEMLRLGFWKSKRTFNSPCFVGHPVFDYRCRVEMYDRDVELLQFCAANLEPEQFLVHLLNKFGLVTWASQVT